MMKHVCMNVVAVIVFTFVFTAIAGAQQFPLLDDVANKVVQKYQQSTCQQLWQEKASQKAKSEREERLVQLLRDDPAMRAEFFNRVSVPIATKMFECGMIP